MSFKYENQEEFGQQLVPLLVDENAQKVNSSFYLSYGDWDTSYRYV